MGDLHAKTCPHVLYTPLRQDKLAANCSQAQLPKVKQGLACSRTLPVSCPCYGLSTPLQFTLLGATGHRSLRRICSAFLWHARLRCMAHVCLPCCSMAPGKIPVQMLWLLWEGQNKLHIQVHQQCCYIDCRSIQAIKACSLCGNWQESSA